MEAGKPSRTALAAAAHRAAFFTWLGVVPDLTREAIFITLRTIAGFPSGSHVVLDYADPPETLDAKTRAYHDRRSTLVEALREPWKSYFEPAELHVELRHSGFTKIEDLGLREIRARFFPQVTTAAPERGGHVLHATSG